MPPIIGVENLGKKFILRHQQAERHTMLRDALAHHAKCGLRLVTGRRVSPSTTREDFWALKDVSFTVQSGDRVGIIGRNGAGKSTLLKILSRITEPTKGKIAIRGRVASLLEVGTGFHPELTGRENIYLNGAILGMTRAEITRQFDQIVDFAEVEKFLDTPVKRYSSGMYVRLAFAIAAHLTPEILIVDEVLAVGDAQFQKKCLGKMQDIGREGRTILFVSHSMAAISNLCSSCLLVNDGALEYAGPTEEALALYMRYAQPSGERNYDLGTYRPSWARPLISSARILGVGGQPEARFPLGGDVRIEMSFAVADGTLLREPAMGVVIHHDTLGPVAAVDSRMTGFETRAGGPYSSGSFTCRLQHLSLLPGRYTVELTLADGVEDLDTLDRYLAFEIEETDLYGTGRPPARNTGVIFLTPSWRIDSLALGEKAA